MYNNCTVFPECNNVHEMRQCSNLLALSRALPCIEVTLSSSSSVGLCRYFDTTRCKGVGESRLLDQLAKFLVRERTKHFSCTHDLEILVQTAHSQHTMGI